MQQQEEPLYSAQRMDQYKQKEFREYLVKQEMVLSIVKFLLQLKTAKEKPESPSQALMDFFGGYKDESWKEFERMQESIQQMSEENVTLQATIEELQQKIETAKQERLRREEEERQRELEAQQKKDNKKPAKK